MSHNPTLLGLFFSILDQFSLTSHFVSDGRLYTVNYEGDKFKLKGKTIPGKIFFGFVNWFGHIMSDVSGSSKSAEKGNRGTGIPSSFWTWTNDIIAIKVALGIEASELDKAMNEFALDIYKEGYDARFQTTQTIPVLVNELIVRLFYSIRRMFHYFKETAKEERILKLMWKKCEPFSNPTVKRMLTVAHGTFCLLDAGDATIRSFMAGGGSFNAMEFVLRLNLPGLGRFAISLYGEGQRAIEYHQAKKASDFAKKEIVIVENYMEVLKILAMKYDDQHLITFIHDFKNSDAYINVFQKSVQLAQLCGVDEGKVLKNKTEIDKYFWGN